MEFFNLLSDLKMQYENDCIERRNGTLLLGPGKIPNCRHMLFSPLTQEQIQGRLIDEYKNKFPEEYIQFLRYSNGANLFAVKVTTPNFSFAHDLFVIYGRPFTRPYSRPADMEEPFDVRIESLACHKEIPLSWLKCGTYIRSDDIGVQTDIFIDTTDEKVYACEKNKKEIVDQWDNLDSCFCSIFNSLKNTKDEYQYDPK